MPEIAEREGGMSCQQDFMTATSVIATKKKRLSGHTGTNSKEYIVMKYKEITLRGYNTEIARLHTAMFMHRIWYERPVTRHQLKAKLIEYEISPIGNN